MSNIKEKANNFWEEHKSTIKKVGVGIGIGVGVIVAGKVSKKIYVAGAMDGALVGFHLTLDWLDKTFPEESKARELYKLYAEAHPEEIAYREGFGNFTIKTF